MEYILITNNPDIAKYAEDCGVHRIMVDLEIIGKLERQGHLNTVISYHTLEDIENIRKVINYSKLMVRINPWHENSKNEINDVINAGADILMLPMFKYPYEVENFINSINHKIQNTLLLETSQALVRIDDILDIPGINEIHIGLNDLHLAMGLDFMFELLSGGIIDYLAAKFKNKNIKFGFGGIARLGYGKIDASIILSEHIRLGSEIVILSRDFTQGAKTYQEFISKIDLKNEIEKINNYINNLKKYNSEILLKNKEVLKAKIKEIIKKDGSY